jgi:energy-coupling factor transport system substrate-specific component
MAANQDRRLRFMFAGVCIALNVSLAKVANLLALPVTMDAIGTIVAAALLPWPFLLMVAIASSLVAALVIHPAFALYVGTQICMAVAAKLLVRYGGFRTMGLAALSGFGIGIVSAVVSAPVTALVFGGVSVPSLTALNALFLASGSTLWASVIKGSLIVESLDKVFAGIVAWQILRRVRAVTRE